MGALDDDLIEYDAAPLRPDHSQPSVVSLASTTCDSPINSLTSSALSTAQFPVIVTLPLASETVRAGLPTGESASEAHATVDKPIASIIPPTATRRFIVRLAMLIPLLQRGIWILRGP
jgi:hypothetical protein